MVMSHRENFEFELSDLQTDRDGRDAIRAAAKELEDAGYLVRTRRRNSDGSLGSYLWETQDPTSANPI
jgi:hypothetical protein